MTVYTIIDIDSDPPYAMIIGHIREHTDDNTYRATWHTGHTAAAGDPIRAGFVAPRTLEGAESIIAHIQEQRRSRVMLLPFQH